MKEPIFSRENGLITCWDESFDGYAKVSEDLHEIEDNRYGIKHVFSVKDKLLKTKKDAMCANGGWFYVWEYKPNATVFFVRADESDTFDIEEFAYHIAVGKLAHGQSTSTLALMTTISEDAMDILQRFGEFLDATELKWSEWP